MGVYSVDALSISKIGDLLVEQLGDEAADYTFPEDFEKAIVDIGFSALVPSALDLSEVTIIGDANKVIVRPTSDVTPVSAMRFSKINFLAYYGTSLGDRVFYAQSVLRSIVIPSTVKNIGVKALGSCSALESVVLPEGLTNIYESAFANSTSLDNIYFPDSVAYIGPVAFSGCSSLRHARMPISANYAGGDNRPFGGVFNDSTVGGEDGDYDVKLASGTTRIPSSMFRGSGITSVVLPETVTTIETAAFYGCSKLKTFTFSPNVTSISSDAFVGSAITNLELPIGVTNLNRYTFANMKSLETFTANGVLAMEVGNSAGVMPNCTSLRTVMLPKCTLLTGYGTASGAFENATALETVQIGSVGYVVSSIQNRTFLGCTNASLEITIYTASQYVDTLLTNIRNGATNATIVIKAAVDTEYNGATYSAGDTILTSVPDTTE